MTQRYVRTFDPNLSVTTEFKALVKPALTDLWRERVLTTEAFVAALNEVAHLTKVIRTDGNVGLAVAEYIDYRIGLGPEPEWHVHLMSAQDAEDAGKA